MSNSISAYAGIGRGMTWPGTDNELGRVLLDQLIDGDLVVSEDVNGSAFENEVLVDIPREGVVIVDEYEV